MSRSLRILLLAALIVLLTAAQPAVAQDRGAGDQEAVAENDRDGASLFELAFSVRRVMDDTIDQTNAAVATGECDACRTVAISVQILIVSGAPDTVEPTNVAVALNEECPSCATFAGAYQFVVGGGENVRLTGQGRRQVAEVRRAFRELDDDEIPIEEVRRRADELAQRLREVLARELTSSGRPQSGAPPRGERDRGEEGRKRDGDRERGEGRDRERERGEGEQGREGDEPRDRDERDGRGEGRDRPERGGERPGGEAPERGPAVPPDSSQEDAATPEGPTGTAPDATDTPTP